LPRPLRGDLNGQDAIVLDLFPDSAEVQSGELRVAGAAAIELADEFGTPLVVYCEQTLRTRAREYRAAAPAALVLYSVKAFPSVALLRLFAEEGLGAEVSTGGELEYARRAGIAGERIVVDGNNKSDEEIRASAELGATLVVDSLDDLDRANEAGVPRALVRVTPGIDAETHDAIRTGHTGSKFGLSPGDALEAIRRGRIDGLHVHIGSQLVEVGAMRMTVEWLAAFAAAASAKLDWRPMAVNLGGGLGIRYHDDDAGVSISEFVDAVVERLEAGFVLHGLPVPELILEPGRSLVGQAGVTLYRVGVVKRASETQTYVAIDGGMSDNPRPQLYGARFTALLANRADEPAAENFTVCGMHCESGDVLIDRVALPEPHRGDLLAVPATGAYTLALSSNYNGVPRPAAVLVSNGRASLIRRRETVDDLLSLES
jgi:diaminopimelate decarboxylase